MIYPIVSFPNSEFLLRISNLGNRRLKNKILIQQIPNIDVPRLVARNLMALNLNISSTNSLVYMKCVIITIS